MRVAPLAVLVPVIVSVLMVLLVLLTSATLLATWLVRFRARRLPDDLSERLSEEWRAELSAIGTPWGKLFFALTLALTRSKTLIAAANGDEPLDEAAIAAAVNGRVYSTLSLRFWAVFVDWGLFEALGGVFLMLTSDRSPAAFIAFPFFTLVLALVFNLACTMTFGGTPGKRLLRLRIVSIDGRPLTWRQATLRMAPDLVLSATQIAVMLTLLSLGAGLIGPGLTVDQRNALMQETVPLWLRTSGDLIMLGWLMAEFTVFVASAERRALHDHVARTVVVRDAPYSPATLGLR